MRDNEDMMFRQADVAFDQESGDVIDLKDSENREQFFKDPPKKFKKPGDTEGTEGADEGDGSKTESET